jgi:hypothetical protein
LDKSKPLWPIIILIDVYLFSAPIDNSLSQSGGKDDDDDDDDIDESFSDWLIMNKLIAQNKLSDIFNPESNDLNNESILSFD